MEIVSSAMMLVNLVVHVLIAIIAVFTMFVMLVVHMMLARLLWRNINCVASSYNNRSCNNNCTHLWMSLVTYTMGWRLYNCPYSTAVNCNVNVALGVCCSYAYHAY